MSTSVVDELPATDPGGSDPTPAPSATACIDGNEAAAKVAYALVGGGGDLSDHSCLDDG